ncbi:MAG: HAMP domain-containing sensor histidine kinase [Tissierellia bacterium]|nr:HAMP domain-containing sensor histidine kinase [Tissierellia bacterium]
MAVKRQGRPLKFILFQYLLSTALVLVAALGLSLIAVTFLSSRWMVPANETENQILQRKSQLISGSEFDPQLLPSHSRYLLLSPEGEILQTDMEPELQERALEFHGGGGMATPSSSFMELERADGSLILNYPVRAHYKLPWMEAHLPGPNVMLALLVLLLCLGGVLWITLLWGRKITGEMAPIFRASREIGRQNLDFTLESSQVAEFNELLEGLEELRVALGDALRENWLREEERRNGISALAHDLKTPLAVIQGNGQLLQATELSREQERYVAYILKNVQRLEDYSRALRAMNESLNLEPSWQILEVGDFAEKMADLAGEIAAARGVDCLLRIQVGEGKLRGDLQLLTRAVENIVANGLAYGRGPLEFHGEWQGKTLKLTVVDHGPGFSPQALERATEQFYRGDESRSGGGHYGMGLYIARQILEGHGGGLILKNLQEGPGGVVELHLPLLEEGGLPTTSSQNIQGKIDKL